MTDKPDSAALLPCPFCGGAAEIILKEAPNNIIRCGNICAVSPSAQADTWKECVIFWNTRQTLQREVSGDAGELKDGLTWLQAWYQEYQRQGNYDGQRRIDTIRKTLTDQQAEIERLEKERDALLNFALKVQTSKLNASGNPITDKAALLEILQTEAEQLLNKGGE